MFRYAISAVLTLTLSACCSDPADELDTPPSFECSTGTTHGYDLAVWDCVLDERVVAWRASAEMSCGDVTVEKASCGTPTMIERSFTAEEHADCDGRLLTENTDNTGD